MKELRFGGFTVNVLKEKCPIHHVNLIQIKGHDPVCPKCQEDKTKSKEQKMVNAFKEESFRGYLKHDSLVDSPSEYDYTFSNFKANEGTKEARVLDQAKHIAYYYIKYPSKQFATLFYGTPGEGKTHLAMAMLNGINENAKPLQRCLFVNVNSLFLKIRASFNDSTALWTEDYAKRKLSESDVLVIDDLGSESAMNSNGEASNFVQRVLYEVTNKQKRIITTTNLTMQQLRDTYNPKLVSRLMAGSDAVHSKIDFSGIKDKRGMIV